MRPTDRQRSRLCTIEPSVIGLRFAARDKFPL